MFSVTSGETLMNKRQTSLQERLQEFSGIFERQVSLFDNALTTENPQHITLKELLHNLKTGVYAEQVNTARKLLESNKSKYDNFKKKNVAGFTLSANCNHRKTISKTDKVETNKLIYHTGILQIDIDNIGKEKLTDVKRILQSDKHTLFSFVSLSGQGLKAGIIIDGSNHKESFLQAEQYYKETYNLTIDRSVKDIFRLCFVSFDTDLFINPNAETFTLQYFNTAPVIQVSAILQKPELNDNSTGNGIEISAIQQLDSAIQTQVSAILQKPDNVNTNISINDRISKYTAQAIANAKKVLNDSTEGNRHNARLRAGELLGGYVAGGFFTEEYAIREIQSTVLQNTTMPIEKAMKTLEDGMKHGRNTPITFESLESNREDFLQRKNIYPEHRKNVVQSINIKTGEITEIEIPFCFWFETVQAKEVLLKIEYTKLYDYLKEIGIRILKLDDSGLKRILVRIENNIVSETDIAGIQNLVNQYVESLPENISENKTKVDLHELLIKGINVYINYDRLNYYIPHNRIEFLQDSKDESFFFFRNGFVEVSKNSILLKPYKELHGFIWKSQIIEHDFEILQNAKTHKVTSFDFVKFTQNICSIKEPKQLDAERYESLISTIGYLLHNHKTSANKFAVILTESNVDDEPQGRTGKGLLLQSISKLRKVTTIDGKNFSFDSQFAFQNVELDTQILFFDDVKQNFNFQRLFSAITEGLSFERKHKDRINLTAEQSPKIVISTNHSIQGNSESDKGRKYEMELLCYYNANFRPSHDFGADFFHPWSAEEWNTFYNFMLNCVQKYLGYDNKIPVYSSATIEEKKLLNSTSTDFIQFADNLKRNESLPVNETYHDFLEFAGIDMKEVSKIRFSKWIQLYCEFKKLKYNAESQLISGKTFRFHHIKEE